MVISPTLNFHLPRSQTQHDGGGREPLRWTQASGVRSGIRPRDRCGWRVEGGVAFSSKSR